MVEEQSKQESSFSFETGGAFIQQRRTVRAMKTYPLSENELESVTLLNTLTSGSVSLGTAVILFALGVKASAIMQGILTDAAAMLADIGLVFGVGFGIVCYVFALWASKKRKSMLQRVREETGDSS